jgi:hypothetical protein
MFGAVRRSRDECCTHLRYKVRNGRNMRGTRVPATATFWGPEGPDVTGREGERARRGREGERERGIAAQPFLSFDMKTLSGLK